MLKVTSNSNAVMLSINKSMKAKEKAIMDSVNTALTKIHLDAKTNASNNTSPEKDGLVDAIEINLLKGFVGVNNVKAPFAPFIEFGTKSKTNIKYRITAAIANKYSGKPLDTKELAERIERTEGASKDKARAIATSIGKNGTKPRPFFYTSVFKNTILLRRELSSALKKRK
jgi:hypothetical protein